MLGPASNQFTSPTCGVAAVYFLSASFPLLRLPYLQSPRFCFLKSSPEPAMQDFGSCRNPFTHPRVEFLTERWKIEHHWE